MRISVEQYRSRIGSHDNFLKVNDALSRFKDRLLEYNANDVLHECLLFTNIETSCWTIHKKWNEAVFWFSLFMY